MKLARRILGIPALLLVAVLVQVSVVNRAPLPGEGGPDLVLLTVAALGAMLGPMAGLLTGFCGGLALDVAPPTGHLAGEYALVFCLAGYACGRMRDFADPMEEHAAVTTVTVMAIGAAGGEAAKALLGLMLSDPDATFPAVLHVLPGAIVYNLLLAPVVLWLTVLTVRRPVRESPPDPHSTPPRTASDYGAVRAASTGAAPKLNLGGASLTATKTPSPGTREPKLRLGGATSPSLSRTDHGASSASPSPGGRKAVPVNFSGSGLIGGLGARLNSAGNPLRGSDGLGKGWLRAGKPGGESGGLKGGALKGGGLAGGGLKSKGPGKGWLGSSSGPGGSGPRSPSGPKMASPGRGWLKTSKPASTWRPKSPGRGWLNSGGSSGFRRGRGPRIGGRR